MNANLLDTWQRGTSPFNALRANSTLVEADTIKLEEPSILWSLVETLGQAGLHAQENDVSFPEAAKRTMAVEQEKKSLENSAKARFFDALATAEIIALGFETPRRKASIPVTISPRTFRFGINWRLSTVDFEGLSFVAVRIVPATMLSIDATSLLSASDASQLSKRPIGRPTLGPDLVECFDALVASGQIEVTKSFASQVPSMRDWLSINKPDLHVPNDEISIKTFRNHLSNKFNALRVSPKLK